MASITQRGSKWRAQIRKNGRSLSETFNSQAEAVDWAYRTEAALTGKPIVQIAPAGQPVTEAYCPANFREILERYVIKVTPTKKTADRERLMISKILEADWVDMPLHDIRVETLTDYRDSRLEVVSPATVRRHFDIIKQAAKTAEDIWEWVSIAHKLAKVRVAVRQSKVFRRIPEGDLEAVLAASKEARADHIYPAIVLSLETAMRRGELAKLQWRDVDVDGGYLIVREPKNGHDREIVLSPDARAVLKALEPSDGLVLQTTDKAITEAWKRVKRKAKVEMRFHDLRHEAVSRFFEKGFTPIEAASMSGHKTMSQLMRYSHAARDKMLARMNEVMS